MKQANYNGRLREALAALGVALAALGVALTASHRLRGAICLDIIYFPRMSPRFARLNTGLRTAATPPGCPARSASNWVADCVPCDADSSLAADGNQRGEFAMPRCLSGGVALLPACRLASRGSIRGYAQLRPLRGALLASEQLGSRLRAL